MLPISNAPNRKVQLFSVTFIIITTIVFVNVIVVLQYSLSPIFLAAGLEGGKKVTIFGAPKNIAI